jgi:hypothetical protein
MAVVSALSAAIRRDSAMRRRSSRLLSAAVALVVGVGVAGCTVDDDRPGRTAKPGTETTVPVPEQEVALRLVSSLRPFDTCGDLLEHARAQAAAHADRLGVLGGGRGSVVLEDTVASVMPAASGAAAARGVAKSAPQEAASGMPAFSGTNVQEAGVDEPDTVKTDGKGLFTIARGRLQALDVADGRARPAGSLELAGAGGGAQLLLAGDHLLVISAGWTSVPLGQSDRGPTAGAAPDMTVPGRERTVLRLVDVSDPARMRVLSTLEVDGHVAGARMVGDVVRLVSSASPAGFRPVFPLGPAPEQQAQARQENLRQVEGSTLVNWLPSFRLETHDPGTGGPAVSSGLLVACDRVSRPAEFSGLGTLSVLTFDLSAADLGDGEATSVLADAETVYASAESLYVATTRQAGAVPSSRPAAQPLPGLETTTVIHKFDITGAAAARHVATGEVRGRVLNQFSLSEHEGHLRVATTNGFAGAGSGSESFVTLLAERDGRLSVAGEVGNLGRGERIYAVRFLGDVGYVVTFRQTDPLYTLDLSDPTRPLVVGELKIPGYSAYLHPVGDGLLLGVGQDATDAGRRLGAQLSLFDVSDPARPKRLQQAALGSGASAVEYDHHAFLWWGPRRLAVVPVQTWDGRDPFSGVVGFRVDRQGLAEIGRVSHDDRSRGDAPVRGALPITRSVVVGDSLLTLSEDGVRANALGTLSPLQWVPYP